MEASGQGRSFYSQSRLPAGIILGIYIHLHVADCVKKPKDNLSELPRV